MEKEREQDESVVSYYGKKTYSINVMIAQKHDNKEKAWHFHNENIEGQLEGQERYQTIITTI